MNLIAYGSLMHPSEFADLAPRAAIPVWVHGYCRAFDQRPMWRGGGSCEHTVLAVRPDAAACFNGVLLLGIPYNRVAALDYRERGYVRTRVPLGCVEPFDPQCSPSLPSDLTDCELYVGRSAQRHMKCSPLKDYHALCRGACGAWGRSFIDSFERTTIGGA